MGVSADRLSSLPDPLLSNIVSYLSFKESIKTSVLAKSWLNICKSTTNIEFNELFFVKFDPFVQNDEGQRMAFVNFTKNWIDNYCGNVIDKLSLRLTMPDDFSDIIERCVAFATKNGVKDLNIDFTYPSWDVETYFYDDIYVATVELPHCAYANSGLEYLKLFSCNFFVNGFQNFQALKELSLGYIEARSGPLRAILSSCKMLETLILVKCWNPHGFNLSEENRVLRKLVLNRCHFGLEGFRINAPSLKIFYYHGMLNMSETMEIPAIALEEVNLDFSLEYGSPRHAPFLYKLLKEINTTKVLTVCSYLLQVIPTGKRKRRMQHILNVKHLIMKTDLHKYEFLGITFMLKSCSKLECLTIEMGYQKVLLDFDPRIEFNPERFWIEKAQIYTCMKSNLKKVEFNRFRGTKNELLVLSYFITCSPGLRKISINILRDDVEGVRENMAYRCERAQILRMLPKASRNLEISIY